MKPEDLIRNAVGSIYFLIKFIYILSVFKICFSFVSAVNILISLFRFRVRKLARQASNQSIDYFLEQ